MKWVPLIFFRNAPLGVWSTYAATPQYQMIRLVFLLIGLVIPIGVGVIIARMNPKRSSFVALSVIVVYTLAETALFIMTAGHYITPRYVPLMLSKFIYQALLSGMLILLGTFIGEKFIQKK